MNDVHLPICLKAVKLLIVHGYLKSSTKQMNRLNGIKLVCGEELLKKAFFRLRRNLFTRGKIFDNSFIVGNRKPVQCKSTSSGCFYSVLEQRDVEEKIYMLQTEGFVK